MRNFHFRGHYLISVYNSLLVIMNHPFAVVNFYLGLGKVMVTITDLTLSSKTC